MGVVFRQSIKTTAATFLGAIIGAITVFVSSSLISDQELGFARNLTNQTVVASYFLMFGMSNTLFLYFHRFNDETEKRKRNVFMSICFGLPLLIFIITMIPYFAFQDYLLERFFQVQDRVFMKKYMLCFPLYTLFYLYTTLYESYLLTQMKSAAVSFIREVQIKGLNLILVLLFGFQFIDYTFFIYSFVGSNLIAVIILTWLARKNSSFKFSFQWNLLDRREYKGIFEFASFHALMGISFSLFGFLDAILLTSLNPDGLNAIPAYTNAVFISSVTSIPYRAMNGIASADISKSYAQGAIEKVKDIYSRTTDNIMIASIFMLVLIISNLHNAVALMPASYVSVYSLTLIMLIGKFVDTSTGINDVAINMSPFYKLNFYLSVGLVLVMLLCYRAFIPKYGIYGAAWVFTIALIIFNLLKTYIVWKKMQLNPFSLRTFKIILIGAISLGLLYLIPNIGNPYYDTLMRSIIFVIIYLALIWFFKPSIDLSTYINETIKKKKLF